MLIIYKILKSYEKQLRLKASCFYAKIKTVISMIGLLPEIIRLLY